MKLLLKRNPSTEHSTIGSLYIDDSFFCHTLEDEDRGLLQQDPESIKKKIYGKTAIPKGTYLVVMSYSPRFKTFLPLVLNVPGFIGIRIHAGNTSEHTEGCVLVGELHSDTFIKNSKKTLTKLLQVLNNVNKKEIITLTIE